jgi:hypothetical protein
MLLSCSCTVDVFCCWDELTSKTWSKLPRKADHLWNSTPKQHLAPEHETQENLPTQLLQGMSFQLQKGWQRRDLCGGGGCFAICSSRTSCSAVQPTHQRRRLDHGPGCVHDNGGGSRGASNQFGTCFKSVSLFTLAIPVSHLSFPQKFSSSFWFWNELIFDCAPPLKSRFPP